MSDQNQDDVDDMLASFDSALDEPAESNNDMAGFATPGEEDTGDFGNVQGEASGDPQPWVDYIPACEFEFSDNLEERIEQGFELVNFIMAEKEVKLIDYVKKIGDVRYYDDFLEEVNQAFRTAVRFKHRQVGGKKVVKKARDVSKVFLPSFGPRPGVTDGPDEHTHEHTHEHTKEEGDVPGLSDENFENTEVKASDPAEQGGAEPLQADSHEKSQHGEGLDASSDTEAHTEADTEADTQVMDDSDIDALLESS